MPIHPLVRRDALAEGVPIRVEIAGRAVMLVCVEGTVHALDDACPHNGASLSDGLVREGCVTCPSHLWRFRLLDGARQGNEDVRVGVHPAWVSPEGWVEVDLPAPVPARSLRETLLAHARGEDVG